MRLSSMARIFCIFDLCKAFIVHVYAHFNSAYLLISVAAASYKLFARSDAEPSQQPGGVFKYSEGAAVENGCYMAWRRGVIQ